MSSSCMSRKCKYRVVSDSSAFTCTWGKVEMSFVTHVMCTCQRITVFFGKMSFPCLNRKYRRVVLGEPLEWHFSRVVISVLILPIWWRKKLFEKVSWNLALAPCPIGETTKLWILNILLLLKWVTVLTYVLHRVIFDS